MCECRDDAPARVLLTQHLIEDRLESASSGGDDGEHAALYAEAATYSEFLHWLLHALKSS